VPDDTTETVPEASEQPTAPPADPSTSTGVTIPNPATPDASVSP
jgi:hypothetical protein